MNKRLLTGILGLALMVSSIGLLTFESIERANEGIFTSQNEEENEKGQEWGGAIEYRMQMLGDASHDNVMNAWRQIDALQAANRGKLNKQNPLYWKEMGPDNQGGRTYEIVVDKDDNKVIYALGASAGVFKSTNQGATWFKAGGDSVQSCIGRCMVQTPNGDLYYGTGEFSQRSQGGDGNSGAIGRGIYKSTDKGTTFRLLKSTDPLTPYTGNSPWDYVHSIIADPTDATGQTLLAGNNGGVYQTTDGGKTWKLLTAGKVQPGYNKALDLEVSSDGSVMYAAMGTSSALSIILVKSTDKGATWSRVGNSTVGDKISTSSCRMEIAIAPSDNNTVYIASASSTQQRLFRLEGIYKTTDGGTTWTTILKGGSNYLDPFIQDPNARSPQGDYDNCIVVDPLNKDRIFVGGVHLFEGKLSNNSYQWRPYAVLNYDETQPLSYFNKLYIHADKHCLTIDNSTKTPILYVGTDGGVFKSTDYSLGTDGTFKEINTGFTSIQYYAVSVDPYNVDLAFGGTQDNGTLQVNREGLTSKNSESIKGGDGGYTASSLISPSFKIAESQYGSMQRSRDGKNFIDFLDDANGNASAKNNLKNRIGSNAVAPFVTPFRLWEELVDTTYIDPKTKLKFTEKDRTRSMFVFANVDGIYLSKQILQIDKLPTFFALNKWSGNFYSPLTMEFAPEGDVLYASVRIGGSASELHRISGLNNYRKFDTGSTRFDFDPAKYGVKDTVIFSSSYLILGIGVNPRNGSEVAITLGSYGNTSGHVYLSTNAKDTNASFTNVSANLPNFPVYDAEINFKDHKQIVIGTEVGIWTGYDLLNGGNWKEGNFSGTADKANFPRVPVFMLKQLQDSTDPQFYRSGPIFYAATHGRGFWRSDNLTVVGINPAVSTAVAPASIKVYPNPITDFTNVTYNLPNSGQVILSLISINGQVIKNIDLGRQSVGENNYRLSTEGISSGTYFLKMTSNGIQKVTKVLVQ